MAHLRNIFVVVFVLMFGIVMRVKAESDSAQESDEVIEQLKKIIKARLNSNEVMSKDDVFSESFENEMKRSHIDESDLNDFDLDELDYEKRAMPRMGKRAMPRMGKRAMPRMGKRAMPRMGRAMPRMGRAMPRMGRAMPRMG